MFVQIQEMTFVWRCMFYSALTPNVTRMLDDMFQPGPKVTNPMIEAGEEGWCVLGVVWKCMDRVQ